LRSSLARSGGSCCQVGYPVEFPQATIESEVRDLFAVEQAENRDDLRLRVEKLVEQREEFRLETVDHGQVVKYLGDRPVETAKNCLQRVGSHSRDGFGELQLKLLGEQYQEPEK